MPNFKYFSPLQRLNSGLYEAKIFDGEAKINLFGGRRYHRFAACQESFRDNLLGLHHILIRIGEHYQLTYGKRDRLGDNEHKFIKNTILLSIDVESFLLKMKELLDCVAFFVPFYYSEPLNHKVDGLQKDVRDLRNPWAYRSMKKHFTDGKTRDRQFKEILIENNDWTEDVLWKRDILFHKFHRISISDDYWTKSAYAFLYEFNKQRDFIPDVLSYISGTYFRLVRFLRSIEIHFKSKCENEMAGYKYFYDGSSFANRMDKVHYFFVSYGRFLEGKILLSIYQNLRREIEPRLLQVLSDLKIRCTKCKKIVIKIKPTVGNFVLITASCNCGKQIKLGNSVSKRFSPHFFDRNKKYWDLVPVYKLEERVTF